MWFNNNSGALFTPSQRAGLMALLSERDELITLIARSDRASVERLYNIYSTYSRVIGK